MKFDEAEAAKYESAPCILAFLIHSNRINAEFDAYLSTAIEDLHPLTGENLCVFYLDTKFRAETWSRTEIQTSYPIGYMVPGMSLKPITTRKRIDEQVFLMDLSQHFLGGEHVKMPSIAFFESFHSTEFYVTELKEKHKEEVSDFLLRCSAEASSIWKDLGVEAGNVTPNDRRNAFTQFTPFLRKDKFWSKTKKIAQDNTVLAMAGAAVGLV